MGSLICSCLVVNDSALLWDFVLLCVSALGLRALELIALGLEPLDISDDGVILGWDEALGSEESRVVWGLDKVSCWLLGNLLSVVMSPCQVKLSSLVPQCLALGVLVSLLLMGWHVWYSLLVPVCLGCFEGLWSLREVGWPRSWLTIVVGVPGNGMVSAQGM